MSTKMDRTAAARKVILIVGGDEEVSPELSQALQGLCRVVQAATYEEAAEQLGGDVVDWLVVPAEEFIIAREDGAAPALQADRVLEVIDQGACLLKTDGSLVWANKKFRELPAAVAERVTDACSRTFRRLVDPRNVRPRRFAISTP